MSLKHLFLIQAIVEGLGGILFSLRPEWLLNNGNSTVEAILLSKIIALAALIFGIMSFQIFKYFQYNALVKFLSLIFMSYHIILALNMYRIYVSKLTPSPASFIIHFAFAVLFAAFYLKEKEKFIV